MDVSDISKYEVIEDGIGDYDTKIYKVKRELSVDDNESVLNKIFKPNKDGKIADYLIVEDKDFTLWHICEKLGYEYKNFELTVKSGEKTLIDRYIVIYLNDIQIIDNLIFMLHIQPVLYIDENNAYGFLSYPFHISRGVFFTRTDLDTSTKLITRFIDFVYRNLIKNNNFEYSYFVRDIISDKNFNIIHIL